jgi:hypothetical protein
MIFLNPLFLFGLAAAAIPIVIHLLNLRKIRTIEFSTLTFLKELERTQIRKIKLRQLLLLILRTLLIVFIVLSFARPALRGTGGFIGGDARTSAAIIFDNSASMGTYDERGNMYRQAIDRAIDIVDVMRDGDEITVLRQSDLPDATTPMPVSDRTRAAQLIRETELSSRHRPLDTAMVVAKTMLESSQQLNKEVYIVSDMQRSHWQRGENFAPESIARDLTAFIIPVGSVPNENASIEDISFRNTLLEPGKPVSVDVMIRNHGTGDLHDHMVSVYLDGSRIAQKNLHIPAKSGVTAEFLITPERTGFIDGYAEIEDDSFLADNRRYFTLTIPERINILLVGTGREDLRFISTALSAQSRNGEHSVVGTEFTTPENFPAVNLAEYDVVIASDIRSWSDTQTDRISSFIEEGGGFILFPGDEINTDNYNSTLLPRLGLPFITGIEIFEQDASARFDRIDYDHPIFSGIFEERLRGGTAADRIESPRIQRIVKFGSARTADSPVISTSGDNMFLISARRGNGTVLIYAVQPILQWSDFPLRGIFVPLIHRSVLYASASDQRDESFIAGETVTVTISASHIRPNAVFNLIHPDNSEERIQPRHLSAGGILQFPIESANEPGIYRIFAGDRPVKVYAANLHPGESDGTRLEGEETGIILRAYGFGNIHILSPDDDISRIVHETRYGTELWKTFLLLALIAVAAETVLARDTKQRTEEQHQKLS